MNCFLHPAIYLSQTARKGRGMFCSMPLVADTLIETSPMLTMSTGDRDHLRATPLHDYIFGGLPADDGPQCAIGFGYLSVYNHSYAANCRYEKDFEQQTMSIIAVRNIAAGEELTINYNGTWNDVSPLWFDAE